TAALATGGDLCATQALCGAGTRCGGCFDAVEAIVASARCSADAAALSVARAGAAPRPACRPPGLSPSWLRWMQSDPRVVDALNEILTAELTAVNQYFIHAKMCDNWGYERLAAHGRDESIDEMKHAEALIERILYFDGTPNMQRLFPVRVGDTVQEQLEL